MGSRGPQVGTAARSSPWGELQVGDGALGVGQRGVEDQRAGQLRCAPPLPELLVRVRVLLGHAALLHPVAHACSRVPHASAA